MAPDRDAARGAAHDLLALAAAGRRQTASGAPATSSTYSLSIIAFSANDAPLSRCTSGNGSSAPPAARAAGGSGQRRRCSCHRGAARRSTTRPVSSSAHVHRCAVSSAWRKKARISAALICRASASSPARVANSTRLSGATMTAEECPRRPHRLRGGDVEVAVEASDVDLDHAELVREPSRCVGLREHRVEGAESSHQFAPNTSSTGLCTVADCASAVLMSACASAPASYGSMVGCANAVCGASAANAAMASAVNAAKASAAARGVAGNALMGTVCTAERTTTTRARNVAAVRSRATSDAARGSGAGHDPADAHQRHFRHERPHHCVDQAQHDREDEDEDVGHGDGLPGQASGR